MNILIDDISQTVKEKIKEDFDTNFRTTILFELLMQDNEISNEAKIIQALKLYYKKIPKDIKTSIENILWFYSGGKEKKILQETQKENTKQIYSYEFDAEYIYSAFIDQYNINLQTIEYLHWWEFKAMFQGLKEDNLIVKIMGYRSINLGEIKDKEEKKYYKKLKKLYALPDMRTEEQKEADFGKAFW